MTSAFIHSFSHYLPTHRITSAQTEELIRQQSQNIHISSGIIEQLTHITSRPQAESDVQASDLATEAGLKTITQSHLKKTDIDLLIFASASHDISEPATANIVQQKLGLTCPTFDLKNACNSFMNGLEVASAFVESDHYKNVLVVTGEIPSRLTHYDFQTKSEFKEAFASFTLGDAGGAALVSRREASNILYRQFHSDGKYWEAAAVLGGGSLFPKDLTKFAFHGEPNKLKEGFLQLGLEPLKQALKATEISLDQVQTIFVHQVGTMLTDLTIDFLQLPKEKVYRTVERHGNLASASLPVAISESIAKGITKTGDLVLIIGMASGISATVWILRI